MGDSDPSKNSQSKAGARRCAVLEEQIGNQKVKIQHWCYDHGGHY